MVRPEPCHLSPVTRHPSPVTLSPDHMHNLSINIAGLQFKNPVTTASGTFGYGDEFLDFIDMSRLGGIFVKAVTAKNRDGNTYPRMAETASGMLNSVGLQNKGVDHFCREIYPRIKDFNTHIIVNVSGSTVEEYVEVAEIGRAHV